jgi:hypothetical protein
MTQVVHRNNDIDAYIAATSSTIGLHSILREVNHRFANGEIPESEHERLSAEIQTRLGRNVAYLVDLKSTRSFPRRTRQRSPDRERSRMRRRMFGSSGIMPGTIGHHFTEGERSALHFIAEAARGTGFCDWPIDKIAAKAGICRTSVQNAIHEARRLGFISVTERPQRGAKSLTNIIEIMSPEWKKWLAIRGWDVFNTSKKVAISSTAVDRSSTDGVGCKTNSAYKSNSVSTTESRYIRRTDPGPKS